MKNLSIKTEIYAFTLLQNERNFLKEVLRDKENQKNSTPSEIKEITDKIINLSIAMNKIA